MPWLTSYSDSNKIVDGSEYTRVYLLSAIFGFRSYYRDVRTDHYRYIGMDLTTAQDCQSALHDPANGVTAHLERENAAGAYQIIVADIVEGEWTEL